MTLTAPVKTATCHTRTEFRIVHFDVSAEYLLSCVIEYLITIASRDPGNLIWHDIYVWGQLWYANKINLKLEDKDLALKYYFGCFFERILYVLFSAKVYRMNSYQSTHILCENPVEISIQGACEHLHPINHGF